MVITRSYDRMRVLAQQCPVRLSLRSEEQGRLEIPSLSVAVSQPAGATSSWTLRVEGRFSVQGIVRSIGSVESLAPSVSVPAKVVAIAHVPGTVDWFVQVERTSVGAQPSARDDVIDVDLSASPDGCMPGLHAIPLCSQLVSSRYDYLSGILPAGGTTVAIPVGSLIQTISAFQIGSGGTVQLDAGNVMPIPPDGAIQFGPKSSLVSPVDVHFVMPAGGGGYLIEVTR